jgi:hypothetical protein
MLYHLKQVPDDGGVTAMGTQVQRCIPLGVGGVDNRACAAAAPAGPQQQLDGVRVATPCGQVQRGVAAAVQAGRQCTHRASTAPRPTPDQPAPAIYRRWQRWQPHLSTAHGS